MNFIEPSQRPAKAPWAVPLADVLVDDELRAAVDEVISSGWWSMGPKVLEFEAAFAEFCAVPHALAVANGTAALTIALRAVGVEPGDDVVVPSFTFYATPEAVVAAGAVPVFCDIDPATFCVTRETVERAMTERTRAVVPVHLFGNVAPVDDLRDLGVPIV